MNNYLWTPWRMIYIAGTDGPIPASPGASTPEEQASQQTGPDAESTGCVFCDRVRQPESQDRANLLLLRADHNFIILNLYPYNSAHLMIVPYHHTSDFVGLPPETLVEMMALAQKMVRVIGEEYHPEGFNL